MFLERESAVARDYGHLAAAEAVAPAARMVCVACAALLGVEGYLASGLERPRLEVTADAAIFGAKGEHRTVCEFGAKPGNDAG